MTAPALSVDEVQAAAAALGKPVTDGIAPCPICAEPIAVSQNGVGAKLAPTCDCSTAAIVAVYQAAGATTDTATSDTRVTRLAHTSQLLDLPVTGVIKHGRNGDAYDLVLADGRNIRLGSARDLLNKRAFEAAILGQADHLVVIDGKEHRNIVDAIVKVAERRDTVTTDEDETMAWLVNYARLCWRRNVDLSVQHLRWEILDPAASRPFTTDDRRLCLRLDDLVKYIGRELVQRVTTRELSVRLSSLGFTKPDEGGQLAQRDPDGGPGTRKARYWISPPDFEALG